MLCLCLYNQCCARVANCSLHCLRPLPRYPAAAEGYSAAIAHCQPGQEHLAAALQELLAGVQVSGAPSLCAWREGGYG